MARKKDEKAGAPERRSIARNRRAAHDYHLEPPIEAGIALRGSEVKSLRDGRVALDQAFARIADGEVWLVGLNIAPFAGASWTNHEPLRRRKLLLHRAEIRRLEAALRDKGRTLVPLELFFNADGRVKVLLAVGTGRRRYDKREALAKKDAQREIVRAQRSTRER